MNAKQAMRSVLLGVAAQVVCGFVMAEENKEAVMWVMNREGQLPAPKIVADVCAWPNLTRLPNGDIVALIYNQPSHGRMPGDVDCWASTDEGETWTKRSTAAPRGTPEQNRMNVAAGLTAEGDLILVTSGWSAPGNPEAWSNIGEVLPTWVCISKDGGVTWSIDKESFPRAPDGRELIPFGDIMPGQDGRLRVAAYRGEADEAAQEAAKDGDPLVRRAAAGQNWVVRGDGRTWDAPVPVTSVPRHNETTLLHLGDGKWLAAARRGGMLLSYSEDDARTWIAYGPGERGRVTPNSHHPGHLTRLNDGSILLSYGNRARPGPGVEVLFSDDEGLSWSAPYRLLDVDSGDSGYPSSVQREDSQIVTAYYAKGIPGHGGYHMGVVIWDPARTRNRGG
ncbi:MAG: glycoside hydrolase [Lentisphaerae bacterium]|nr:glycoside hydrolase [Lentisphaerota bacterium]